MSGNGGSHPGRSVEFLSRLHDGELDAAERARFESHRAHCAECRRAALEFEDAISLFRSARSTPPRSDLASRILRKVQSTNRPRAPFSPRFQIDLGWAALLVTALLAVLVMTPILGRRPEYPRVIPIRSVTAPASEPAKDAAKETAPRLEAKQGPPRERDLREARRAGPRAVPAAPENRDVLQAEAERPKTAAAQSSGSTSGSTRESLKLEDRRERGALVVAPEAARAGGAEETAVAAPAGTPLKLTFQAIDGYGSSPALLSGAPRDLPVDERGQEYVLLLDSQGIVRRVTPQLAGRGNSVRQGDASAALSRLRFAPGNGPRRLLVRFE
jgi:hypothetical protein